MNQAQSRIVQGNNSRGPEVLGRSRGALLLLGALLALGCLAPADTYAQAKRKVPVLDRLSTGTGPGQQEFTGLVQSLDIKASVLEVRNTRDKSDEYFPFKKNVRVATADGQRLTLDGLKTGSNVLVYFEEKDNRRTVKEIVVLGPPAPEPEKSAPAPPS